MNFLMYNIIFISTLIAISSSNIIIIWLSLELNLFSFILILLDKIKSNDIESSLNYFLSQATGSIIFLLSRIILLTFAWLTKFSFIIIIISILIKRGIAPCYHWFPIRIAQTRWINCFLLSTWQKLAPLLILIYYIMPKNKNIITIIAPINAIIGGIIGLIQTSIKKIIAYSSITHIGWILRRSVTNTPCLFITYFFIYSIIILPLIYLFYKIDIIKTNDLIKSLYINEVFIISILLLSLGGIPPLTGFVPKLLIIKILINHSIIITTIIIIGSIINLFFYINIILNIIINIQKQSTKPKQLTPQLIIISILIINFLIIFIIFI